MVKQLSLRYQGIDSEIRQERLVHVEAVGVADLGGILTGEFSHEVCEELELLVSLFFLIVVKGVLCLPHRVNHSPVAKTSPFVKVFCSQAHVGFQFHFKHEALHLLELLLYHDHFLEQMSLHTLLFGHFFGDLSTELVFYSDSLSSLQ